MAIQTITRENFLEKVQQADRPVLLDVWAGWCGPCRMISPIVDQVAAERPQVAVGKVNVDEQPELAQAFGVMSIPTLVVLKQGKPVSRIVGARPKSEILAELDRL